MILPEKYGKRWDVFKEEVELYYSPDATILNHKQWDWYCGSSDGKIVLSEDEDQLIDDMEAAWFS